MKERAPQLGFCPDCLGSGFLQSKNEVTCIKCNGTGKYEN